MRWELPTVKVKESFPTQVLFQDLGFANRQPWSMDRKVNWAQVQWDNITQINVTQKLCAGGSSQTVLLNRIVKIVDKIIPSTQNPISIQILSLACLIWPIACATPTIERVWRVHVQSTQGDEKLCTSLTTPSSFCLFVSTLIDQLKQLCRLYWQRLRLLRKELQCFEEYSLFMSSS